MAKYHVRKEDLHYLSHDVGQESINVDPGKIEIVMKSHRPLDIRQLQYFLGFCNYFCKIIHGYLTLVALLTSLT